MAAVNVWHPEVSTTESVSAGLTVRPLANYDSGADPSDWIAISAVPLRVLSSAPLAPPAAAPSADREDGQWILAVPPSCAIIDYAWSKLPAPVAARMLPDSLECAVLWLPKSRDDLLSHYRSDLSTGMIKMGDAAAGATMPLEVKMSDESHLPPLTSTGPTEAGNRIRPYLESFSVASLGPVRSEPDAQAVIAGLLLWNGFANASHVISQSIEGEGRHANGDYWHGLMHRQEPDYGNAKYWFRRVGQHPVFDQLAGLEEHEGHWDPIRFIDRCQRDARATGDSTTVRLQALEMTWLMQQSLADALG